MKKTKSLRRAVCLVLTAMLLIGMLGGAVAVSAEGAAAESVSVWVTVSDAAGAMVLPYACVTVTDVDSDGTLTINDALYAAHEAAYPGGAAAGYSYYTGEYGLAIGKLWGDESGAFGYYRNDASAWNLSDPIEEGDHVRAFIYQDQIAWSDSYSFFDRAALTVDAGASVTLTLQASGYDAEWNPVTAPLAGAVLTLDGTPCDYVTDSEGRVTLTLMEAGEVVIGATCEGRTLVPPICVVTVNAVEEQTTPTPDPEKNGEEDGDDGDKILPIACAAGGILFVVIVAAVVLPSRRRPL